MTWIPTAPIPPSQAKVGEAYKLRFLGIEDPDRPVQKGYGNLYVLGIIASIAIVLIASAVFLGLPSQSDARSRCPASARAWDLARTTASAGMESR